MEATQVQSSKCLVLQTTNSTVAGFLMEKDWLGCAGTLREGAVGQAAAAGNKVGARHVCAASSLPLTLRHSQYIHAMPIHTKLSN